MSAGVLTLATNSRSFQPFTYIMGENITKISVSGTVRVSGVYKLFLTGGSANYTILAGGSSGLGANNYTNYSTTQTIAANSKWVMYIDFDGTNYFYTLMGPYTG